MDNDNLKALYENTKRLNPDFTADYNSFASSMQDENNRKNFYRNIQKLNPNITALYEDFNSKLGFSTNTPKTFDAGKGIKGEVVNGDTLYHYPDGIVSKGTTVEDKPDNYVELPKEPQEQKEGNLWEGVKIGGKKGWLGAKEVAGTVANQFTENSSNAKKALEILNQSEQKGVDLNGLTPFKMKQAVESNDYKESEEQYKKDMDEWKNEHPFLNILHQVVPFVGQPVNKNPRPIREDSGFGDILDFSEYSDEAPYRLLQDALKTDNPKAYLEEKTKQQSWGDKQISDAAIQYATLPQTKGAGKVGEMIPGLSLFASSILASATPETRWLSKPLSTIGIGMIGVESAGETAMEARKYAEETGKDIPESDILKAMGTSALINTILMHYFGNIVSSGAGKLIGNKIAGNIAKKIFSNPEATKEMGEFFDRAGENIPFMKNFTVEGLKTYGKNVGLGTATLSGIDVANQITPMIYEYRKDYPTFTGIVMNEIKNLPSNILMNAFLSGESRLVDNYAQNARRIKQGNIVLADAGKNGVVEIIGGDDNNYTVLNKDGAQINIPQSEIGETHTVTWKEFKEFSKAPADKVQEAFDNLQEGEKRIITKNFMDASEIVDEALKGSDITNFDKEKILNSSKEQQQQIMDEVGRAKNMTDVQKNAVYNYIYRGNAYMRMQDSFNAKVQDATEKAVDLIKKNVNPDMNGIVKAKVAGTDRQIIKGNIALNEDGGINEEQSSPQVYYKDENGKTQIAPIAHVEELTEHIPQQNALDEAVKMKTNQMILQQMNVEDPYVGESVGFNDNGQTVTIKVNSLNEDGAYNIDFIDNESGNSINSTITKQELQQLFESTNSKENESPTTEKTNQTTGNDAVNLENQDTNANNSSKQKTASQSVEEITARAPKQDNGQIDYKALLNQSPDDYATLLESESTPEEAKKELSAHSKTLQDNIEKKNKKLEKESDPNVRKTIRDDIKTMTSQKQRIDDVVKNRYAPKEESATTEVSAKSIAEKIIKGDKDWSPEELQFQQNYPEQIEKTLKEIQTKTLQEETTTTSQSDNSFNDIKPVGKGFFGNIYDQFKGKAKEAIDFLMKRKEGEALGALHHKNIGDIDLVWGNENAGLAKIAEKHPEMIKDLQGKLDKMEIVSESPNRIILESPSERAIISKNVFDETDKNWLLTAYDKKNAVSANSIDNETEPQTSKRIDTATSQNRISTDKGSENNRYLQESGNKNFVSEYNNQPLTIVEGLGMGQNQAKGTYVSFEPKNRYETENNKAKQVEIKLDNPIEFDQNQDEFAALQQQTLLDRFDDFKVSDFNSINEGEVPTIDNLNEKGIDRLSGFVTEELKNQGHDGIVFNGDGEHEIVVFDKDNVRDKSVTKPGSDIKSKQRTKRTKSETPRTELQKFINNTNPSNLYEATLLHLMGGGQLSRQHYLDATGYKTNDLGRLKFLLTDKGTPFDIFEQNYYGQYRPDEFERGFDSNTDEIVQAINDYKQARGSGYELMKKFGEGKQDEYYKDNIEGLVENKQYIAKFEKPNIFDHFYELYSDNLQNFTTFDEFLGFLDDLNQKGEFSEHSFPFSPNDYTDIKNYIENARNEGKSYDETVGKSSPDLGRGETDAGNSDAGIGSVSVPPIGERATDRTNNEGKSESVESGSDGNIKTGTGEQEATRLTPLQQKYVDEQTSVYDKKIADAKKVLDSAISERNKNAKEFNKANNLFRDETEQRNMFGDEGMTDVSNENAKRINEKYQSEVDKAKEEYNRLVNDRSPAIEKFTKDAQSQSEIQPEKTPQEQLNDVGGDILAHAKNVVKNAEIKSEEAKVNTTPTEAQKEAGNYKKGHVEVQGFDVSIEQPRGSVRSGRDENGNEWSQEMKNSYGYIRGTKGTDGDHIDVFLGDNPSSDKVFVVDQVNPDTGEYDEHKAMLGFNSIEDARNSYLSNYKDGWKGLGNITETTVDDFRRWADMDGRRTKPFADYKMNQPETDVRFQLSEKETSDLEAVNKRFNDELDNFKAGKLKTSDVLHLGKPLEILKAAGIKEKEISLSQSLLTEKLKQHGLTTEDIKGLAKSIQDPIMVYDWGTKAKSTVIITDLTTKDGRKITLALKAERKGKELSVNDVASIHGKDAERFLAEMGNAKEGGLQDALRYVNKEKALDWLAMAPPKGASQANQELNSEKTNDYLHHPAPIAETSNTQELNSIAKVIQEFENPKLSEEKLQKSDNVFTPITKEQTNALIKPLKAKGVAKDVIVDETEMRDVLDKIYGKDDSKMQIFSPELDEKLKKLFPDVFPVVQDATEKQIQVNGKWYARSISPNFENLEVGDTVPEINPSISKQSTSGESGMSEELMQEAKNYFGTTDDFNEAGYLLPDGTMLDFSEKKDGGEGGYRTKDHRTISYIGDNLDLISFMAMGNIRLSPESGGFEVTGIPTREQIAALKQYIKNFNGDVCVDFSTPGQYNIEHSVEYYDAHTDRVINDIIRYYDEGIKPLTRIRRMSTPKGDVYGFVTDDGVVYLDPKKLNANTPIHEFGHLYWNVMPSEMKTTITDLLKQTDAWKELSENPAYSNLKTDDQKADEIFNTILGNEGEKSGKVQEIIGNDVKLTDKIKNAINDVWEWVKANIFQNTDAKINQFSKKTLGELLNGKPIEKPVFDGRDVLKFAKETTDWNEKNLENSEKNSKFVEQNGNNDRGTEENIKLRSLVERSEQGDAIYKTITEASSDMGANKGTTTKEGRSTWDKEHFLGKLEVEARQNGTWIDDIHELSDKPIAKGQESEVYVTPDNKNVIKINNLSIAKEENPIEDFTDRLSAHNELFPEIPYKIIGFTENSLGEVSFVLEQPYIDSDVHAAQEDIDSYMESRGFERGEYEDEWRNKDYTLWDVDPKNVLKDPNGNLYFIDTVVNHTSKNTQADSGSRFQIIPNNNANDEAEPKLKPNESIFDFIKRHSEWYKKQQETQKTQPENDGGKNMVGISHKALNDLANRIGLHPLERGGSYDPKELADRGRKLLAAGANPKQIEDEFYKKGITDENGISTIRAHIENIYKTANSITDKNSGAFKNAFDELSHYTQVEKDMANKAHRLFKAFQGERDLDTDSFSYHALATQAKSGKPLTEEQRVKIEELTKQTEDYKQQIADYEKKLSEALDYEHNKESNTGKEIISQTQQKKDIVAQGKSLANRIRKAKIHRPDSFMVATPASLAWDGGVEIVARTVETGARLADAIQQGVSYIRNTDWYKNLSDSKKEAAEDDFVNWHNDQSGLTDLQSQFIDKHDNKFTREEARAIWNYTKQNYINNGASYADALSYVANDLGLSMAQVQNAIVTPKNKPLADAVWKANRDLRRNRAATQRWINEQVQSPFVKAVYKAIDGFREIATAGHGHIFIGTHATAALFDPLTTKKGIEGIFDSWKFAYGNTADYELMMRDLENSPNYLLAQKAGLQNNPNEWGSDSEIVSNWFKKWTSAGLRGFNAIKILRQEIFDMHYNSLSASERENTDVLKGLAQLANTQTGATNIRIHGSGGEFYKKATFAGGMVLSRFERSIIQPSKVVGTLINWKNATVAQKIFAKKFISFAARTTAVYLSGAVVNNVINYYNYGDDKHKINFLNPLKGNWLCYKVGNFVINPTSGMLSNVDFLLKLANIPFENSEELKNTYKTTNKKFAAAIAIGKYIEGTLSPFATTAVEQFSHHDYNGNTLPYFDDEPDNKFNHKMGYWEYALSKSPLLVSEGVQEYNSALSENGVPDGTKNAWWKTIETAAINGVTGMRTYYNSKKEGEKYDSLIDYYKKGTDEKYNDIMNETLTAVSKQKSYHKDVNDGKMGVTDYNDKIRELNFHKYNTINKSTENIRKNIKELEDLLPKLNNCKLPFFSKKPYICKVFQISQAGTAIFVNLPRSLAGVMIYRGQI